MPMPSSGFPLQASLNRKKAAGGRTDMENTTRRELLYLGGLVLAGSVISRLPLVKGASISPIPRFEIPLRIPRVLTPVRTEATADYYEITQHRSQVEILPGLRTEVWGYDGMFPGPTIKACKGRKVVVRHTNQLDTPTVVHLHGGVTPPESDGFATDVIMPGDAKTYTYPNNQPAATLWYHDHSMDHTGRNIYMGLSGFYLLEDEQEQSLALPKGECDIPLMISSRSFNPDGALNYDFREALGAEGDTILVNGVPWPRMEVATRKYRFRILNGSNATFYRLALDSGKPLMQIATDTGLLTVPIAQQSIPVAMAERVEVIVDFSAYPIGTRVVLQNVDGKGALGEIMRFDVVRHEHDDALVPEQLSAIEPLPEHLATRTRNFVFSGRPSLGRHVTALWTINHTEFDPNRPIAEPRYGEVEIWQFENHRMLGVLALPHSVHLHLVRFRILDRNGKPPLPHETGWKDTLALAKGEHVRVITRFEGYVGRYMMHCHNLEHEDHSMMARFDVVASERAAAGIV
jgi:spore coat protein A